MKKTKHPSLAPTGRQHGIQKHLIAFLTLFSLAGGGVAFGDSYVVVAKKDKSFSKNLVAEIELAGGTITETLTEVGLAIVESDNPDFASNASSHPGIQSIIPDISLKAPSPLTDTDVAEGLVDEDIEESGFFEGNPAADFDSRSFWQWSLYAIDAPGAWEAGYAGAGVRVAVLDSGIASGHPDIRPVLNTDLSTVSATNAVPGETFEFIRTAANGNFSHSTFVSGILAGADNNLGIVGVAPQVELVAIKVTSDFASAIPISGVLNGIYYAATIDADVLNMSFGGTLPRGGFEAPKGRIFAREVNQLIVAMTRVLNYAHQQGVTMVAAAGNNSTDGDHDADEVVWPRDLPHVISVSATGPLGLGEDPTVSFDTPAIYTDFGQSAIDIAAPGGNFDPSLIGLPCPSPFGLRSCHLFDFTFSALAPHPISGNPNRWGWGTGTSFAAPHVCGVAAMIIGKNGGEMHPNQVRSVLLGTADDLGKPGNDDFYGHGRLNAAAAVSR